MDSTGLDHDGQHRVGSWWTAQGGIMMDSTGLDYDGQHRVGSWWTTQGGIMMDSTGWIINNHQKTKSDEHVRICFCAPHLCTAHISIGYHGILMKFCMLICDNLTNTRIWDYSVHLFYKQFLKVSTQDWTRAIHIRYQYVLLWWSLNI